MKPGGTEGGEGAFVGGLGMVLVALGLYLFFDSVHVTAGNQGFLSGYMSRGIGGLGTASMGLIFVPFLLGVTALFFDSSKSWAWGITVIGLAIIVIEILSRIRFEMNMKTSHLLLVLGMTAAGFGLVMRALRDGSKNQKS